MELYKDVSKYVYSIWDLNTSIGRTAPKQWVVWLQSSTQQPKISKLKKNKTYFIVAMISDILCDLPFSQNQLTQSADDRNMEMFKNITK